MAKARRPLRRSGERWPSRCGRRWRWAALAVGDVVLARDYDRDGESVGWWEAVVLAPADGDAFTLGWRDYPEQGLVRRRRAELAPLHPGGAAPPPAGAADPPK